MYPVSQNTHGDGRCCQLIHSNKTIHSLATHKMRKSTSSWISDLWTTYICEPSLFTQRGTQRIHALLCVPSRNTDITWRFRRLLCSNDNIDSLAVERHVWKPHVTKSKFLTHICTLSSLISILPQAMSVPSPFSNNSKIGFFLSQIRIPEQYVCFVYFLKSQMSRCMGCFFSFS